jgi:hypothetical protein
MAAGVVNENFPVMFIDPVYATVSSRTSNHSADLAHTYNLFPVAIQKICNNNKNRLVIDMYTYN